MPRDQVYQLRLTSEEKAKLASVAKDRDSSIAQMIRKDYGLDEEVILRNRTGKTTRGVVADLAPEWKEPKPIPPEVLEEREVSAKQITTMARQRHGHLPLGLAEREVRKELG